MDVTCLVPFYLILLLQDIGPSYSCIMKVFVLTAGLFAFLVNLSNATETSTYTTKYDGIDLDEILNNNRLLTTYVKCLLEQGPCTPDGSELKKNLPDAIENDCAKCTERQREGADKVMHYIIDHRPDDWIKLEQKYNSDGSYKTKYLKSKEAGDKKNNVTNSAEDSMGGSGELS